MKIGDLVKYKHDSWHDWIGVVVAAIPGTDQTKVVFWPRMYGSPKTASYPKEMLQVISES